MARHQLDFLMLCAEGRRVVVEIDGPQHIQPDGEKSVFQVYEEQIAADRALQLDGYEVYRFGADEMGGRSAAKKLDDFLRRLRLAA